MSLRRGTMAPSWASVTPLPAYKFIGTLLEASEQSVLIKAPIMIATPSQQRFTSLTDTSRFKVLSVASPSSRRRRSEGRTETGQGFKLLIITNLTQWTVKA